MTLPVIDSSQCVFFASRFLVTIAKLADATINALTTDSTPSTVYRFRDESLAPWLPAFTGGVSFFVKSAQPWVNAANGMGLTNGANWQPTWAAPNIVRLTNRPRRGRHAKV